MTLRPSELRKNPKGKRARRVSRHLQPRQLGIEVMEPRCLFDAAAFAALEPVLTELYDCAVPEAIPFPDPSAEVRELSTPATGASDLPPDEQKDQLSDARGVLREACDPCLTEGDCWSEPPMDDHPPDDHLPNDEKSGSETDEMPDRTLATLADNPGETLPEERHGADWEQTSEPRRTAEVVASNPGALLLLRSTATNMYGRSSRIADGDAGKPRSDALSFRSPPSSDGQVYFRGEPSEPLTWSVRDDATMYPLRRVSVAAAVDSNELTAAARKLSRSSGDERAARAQRLEVRGRMASRLEGSIAERDILSARRVDRRLGLAIMPSVLSQILLSPETTPPSADHSPDSRVTVPRPPDVEPPTSNVGRGPETDQGLSAYFAELDGAARNPAVLYKPESSPPVVQSDNPRVERDG